MPSDEDPPLNNAGPENELLRLNRTLREHAERMRRLLDYAPSADLDLQAEDDPS